MTPRFFIYALTDPVKGRRYVGQSSVGMIRPKTHAYPSHMKKEKHLHSTRWIQTLVDQGLMYGVEILEVTVETQEALDAAEIKWIAYGRAQGWHLTNINDGGGGSSGFTHSAEARAKISASHRGKPLSAAHREKISLAQRGKKKNTAAARAKMRLRALGKVLSSEHRAKISAALSGRKFGPLSTEHRAKISAAAKRRKPPSDEHRAKLRAAQAGKVQSAETRAKISASLAGRKLTAAHRAKLSAVRRATVRKKRNQNKTPGSEGSEG